jgi:hypothetical protein
VDVSGGKFTQYRQGVPIPGDLDEPIETLAYLYRRYGVPDPERTVLVAFSRSGCYTRILDGEDTWVARWTDGFSSAKFRCVAYELNEEGHDSVDVLLFSNAVDGMYMLRGDTLEVVHLEGTEGYTAPHKFGVLERSNERIWGTRIDGRPDTILYSRPYNPLDWSQDDDIPEDGGGEINIPSWDGDEFVALQAYGSQLLAFKRSSVWRIYGTDPGEYIVREQPGGGTINPRTLAVRDQEVYMLGWNGILRYDGAGTSAFRQDEVRLIVDRINFDHVDQAVATVANDKYYLAIPVDGSEVNNAVLIYDCREGTYSFMLGVYVNSFLQIENRVFYTSAVEPARVYEMTGKGDPLHVKWESGFVDLDMKHSVKSAFMVYFIAEAEAPFDLYVGIETEKKMKMKRVVIKPGRINRLRMNVMGRFFKLHLRSYTVVPFTITGGVKIDMELDPD